MGSVVYRRDGKDGALCIVTGSKVVDGERRKSGHVVISDQVRNNLQRGSRY